MAIIETMLGVLRRGNSLLSRSVPRRAVVSSSSPNLSGFIFSKANHSYTDRDHLTQETDAVERQAKAEALLSALLCPGYFTLAIGVTANHPRTIRIYAYSICSTGVDREPAVPSCVIVMTQQSRDIRKGEP
jgi:hypothetical protein